MGGKEMKKKKTQERDEGNKKEKGGTERRTMKTIRKRKNGKKGNMRLEYKGCKGKVLIEKKTQRKCKM